MNDKRRQDDYGTLSEVASGQFHKDNLSRILLAIGAVAMTLTLITAVLIFIHTGKGQWNPLGLYPEQQTNQQIYSVHDKVLTTAQKCAKRDGITVRTNAQWVDISEPGLRITTQEGGVATRYKSCGLTATTDHIHFINVIPDPVIAIVKSAGPTSWQLTGTDVPYTRTGRTGESRTWFTNKFTITP